MQVRTRAAVRRASEVSQNQRHPFAARALQRRHQVRQRAGGEARKVTVADHAALRRFEVRGQLVDEDQRRAAAQQGFPVLLPGRVRRGVEVREGRLIAQLLGNDAPQAVRRIPAPVEGHDLDVLHVAQHAFHRRIGDDLRPHERVRGQQAQRDEVVGLATAHALPQEEHAVARLTRESLEALRQQVLHAVRDDVLLEEGLRVDAAFDQVIDVEGRLTLGVFEDGGAGLQQVFKSESSGLVHHGLLKVTGIKLVREGTSAEGTVQDMRCPLSQASQIVLTGP